jgi:hypothetical protein
MSDWRDNLNNFFAAADKKRRQDEEAGEWSLFISGMVIPAFEDLQAELEKHGRLATIRNSVTSATILVAHEGEEEMMYRMQAKSMPNQVLPCVEIRSRERGGLRYLKQEAMLRPASPPYKLSDVTREEIISHFLAHYMRRVENA